MFCTMILFLLVSMMPGTSGMKPTNVNSHEYTKDGIDGIDEITEATWNDIKSMDIKVKLSVKALTTELPVSVYNGMYKQWMRMKQSLTRIASVAILWTPTSTKFNEMATIILIDGRISDDGIRSAKRNLLSSGKVGMDLVGSIITAVPFDPNFQQFITGSLDFATDTIDINKIRFYISFPDTRMAATDSIAGELQISWKTIPDTNGVYENVQWDVFTFERKLPAEVENQLGKTKFQKIKNYLDKKYNERKSELSRLTEFTNSLVWGSDQGLNRMKTQVNEDRGKSLVMIKDTARRIEAIRYERIQKELSEARVKLSNALAGTDIGAIEIANNGLKAVFEKYGMEIPANEDLEEGYAVIGPPQ